LVESVAPKRRRQFSASEKLRIVKAAEAALATGQRGALEALLRKEGIYASHLSKWRQQFCARGASGLEAQKPGRKPKLDAKDRELLAAAKELAAVKRKLEVAEAIIELQKKVHIVLGLALPELDEES
jgi:transposase-like protein